MVASFMSIRVKRVTCKDLSNTSFDAHINQMVSPGLSKGEKMVDLEFNYFSQIISWKASMEDWRLFSR